MPANLVRNDDTLELDLSDCQGGEFQDCLAKVKDVPGSKFDWDRKLWLMPAEPLVAERLMVTIQPIADEELVAWAKSARVQEAEELTTPLPDDAELLIPWATERQPWQPEFVNDEPFTGLYDYQRAAVDHLASAHRAILADDMGLGKTIQAISTVEEYRLRAEGNTIPSGPRLIICPNSVKGSWARELERWLEDPKYAIIDGSSLARRHKQLEEVIAENAWGIVNWEQVRVHKVKRKVRRRNGDVTTKTDTVLKEPLFGSTKWLAVIADEVHRAKNRKAAQTQGLWRIRGDLMLGLSGTPVMNAPDELWAQLRWLFPETYTAYWRFYEQYVEYYENPYFGGKIITGVKNPDALRFELRGRLLRRTTAQAFKSSGKEKPGKRRIYFELPLNKAQQALYDKAKDEIWLQVKEAASGGDKSAESLLVAIKRGDPVYRIPNGAARVVRLRQIIETPVNLDGPDDSALMDDFEERYEDSRPQPWLVFTEFKTTSSVLAKRLIDKFKARVGVYTGDTLPSERTKLEDAFQAGELDVIIGTIDALKEGITLTKGHMQYWMSRDWTPDVNEQGESRQADRVGQSSKVIIFIPQAEHTVAVSKVEPTNRMKEKIVRSIVPKDEIEVINA